jgi:uncharacterized membrane protein YkoI
MTINKQSKRIILVAIAIALLFGASLVVMEKIRIGAVNQAKSIAQKHVSATAEFVLGHNNADSYTFKYFDAKQQERSEIEIAKESGQIRKIQTQKVAYDYPKTVVLSEDTLKEIVKQEIPKATFKEFTLNDHQEEKIATITFSTNDSRGTYLLDPENGSVLARTVKFGKPIVVPTSGGNENFGLLSLSEFKILANRKVPGAIFQDLDIAYKDGRFVAKISLYLKNIKHELELDGRSGAELSYAYYKDEWLTYGNWEPRELETPLLSIINFNAPIVLPNPTVSTTPSTVPSTVPSKAPSIQPSESTTTAAIQPSESKANTSATPTEPAQTQTSKTNATTKTTTKTVPTTVPTAAPLPKPSMISLDRAKALVSLHLPGAEFSEIDLDEDNGRLLYKGKAASGTTEVDFEIDAYTGIFAKWDVDTKG